MEKLIAPFIRSGREILSQMINFNLSELEPYYKKEICLNNHICVIIGMAGVLKGQAVLKFSEGIAKRIASNMLEETPVVILDDTVKRTIGELGTMIIGNAAALMYNMGVSISITPPSILTGNSYNFFSVNSNIICIPFDAGDEEIELNIVFN